MYMDITSSLYEEKKLSQKSSNFSKFPLCTLHKVLKDHKCIFTQMFHIGKIIVEVKWIL